MDSPSLSSPRPRPRLDPSAAARVLALIGETEPELSGGAALPVVPGYHIERLIGAGGGGDVFLARREGSDRPVALKVIRIRASDEIDQKHRSHAFDRAFRELRMLEETRLACLPRLLDYGIHEGRLFLVVELVDGKPLDKFCASRNASMRERVALLADACECVQALHERGLIHRDLKPSNILVTPTGEVMLIDLGIAALAGRVDASTLMEEGSPIGTLAYMAPEQARGERHAMSTRSDVYSLGATAFELLTGSTPHDTDTMVHEAIRRVAQDEPRDPRTLQPDIPVPLAAVLNKSCSREPGKRYDSAAAFRDDLRRWLTGEPVMAQSPTTWHRLVKWAAGRPLAVTASLCVLMATMTMVSSFAGIRWLYSRPGRVVLEQDQMEASVETVAGARLATWRSGSLGRIPLALFIERPRDLGDARMALIQFNGQAERPELSGQLCAFDLSSDLEEPAWLAPGRPGSKDYPRPPRPPQPTDNTFGAHLVLVEDVFTDAESPGKEVVVVMNQHLSPSVARVYDLTGRVLWEAWHRGTINGALWSEKYGALVFQGIDNRFRRATPIGDESERYPGVVFALQPQKGARIGMINPELGAEPSAGVPVDAAALWYRWMHRSEGAPRARIAKIQKAVVGQNDSCMATVDITFEDETSCAWLLNTRGEVVARREPDGFVEKYTREAPDFVQFSAQPPMDTLRPARADE